MLIHPLPCVHLSPSIMSGDTTNLTNPYHVQCDFNRWDDDECIDDCSIAQARVPICVIKQASELRVNYNVRQIILSILNFFNLSSEHTPFLLSQGLRSGYNKRCENKQVIRFFKSMICFQVNKTKYGYYKIYYHQLPPCDCTKYETHIKYYHKVDVQRNLVRDFDIMIDVGDDIDSYVKGNQGLPRAPRTEVERDTNSAQTTE